MHLSCSSWTNNFEDFIIKKKKLHNSLFNNFLIDFECLYFSLKKCLSVQISGGLRFLVPLYANMYVFSCVYIFCKSPWMAFLCFKWCFQQIPCEFTVLRFFYIFNYQRNGNKIQSLLNLSFEFLKVGLHQRSIAVSKERWMYSGYTFFFKKIGIFFFSLCYPFSNMFLVAVLRRISRWKCVHI